MYTVHFIFLSTVCNQAVSQKKKRFFSFYICYVHLDLETLNTTRKKCRKNKLLTDRTNKSQCVVFYLHMYANSTQRYSSTFFRGAPKIFSTRPSPCKFSFALAETGTFFEKLHLIRPPAWYSYLPHPYSFQP